MKAGSGPTSGTRERPNGARRANGARKARKVDVKQAVGADVLQEFRLQQELLFLVVAAQHLVLEGVAAIPPIVGELVAGLAQVLAR